MLKWMFKWATTDADWYQFWYPQSGLLGGVFFGLVITVAIMVILNAVSVW